MINQHTVKHFFEYDPETGAFDRIRFVSNQGVIYERRSPVKSRHQFGYYITVVFGKRYRVHHLIFVHMTGEFPTQYVDHIDGDRTNNRWSNLRLATKSENQRNHGVHANSKTGITGVYWYEPLKKFQAQITVNGERIHLGYFESVVDASVARKNADLLYGFHPNHGERPSWRA